MPAQALQDGIHASPTSQTCQRPHDPPSAGRAERPIVIDESSAALAFEQRYPQRTGLPQLQRDTFQWDGPDTFLLEAADADGQAPADGCELTVHFTEKAATVLQQGGCSGARLEGTYLRDLDDLLTNYEFSPD